VKTKHLYLFFYQIKRLLTICFIAIPSLCIAQDKHLFVASGVLEADSQLVKDFAQYLSENSNYPMKVFFAKDYSVLSSTLNKHPDAVAWTCGAPYVEDRQKYAQKLVAVPLFKDKPTYHSMIISLHGRPESTLLEFKNQVFAYSDQRSNSGYIAPHHHLITQGINNKSFFKIEINAHNHVGSIEAVLGGLADVAAVDEYVLVEYLKNNSMAASELKFLERLGPFPFTPLVTGNKVKQTDIKKLQQALLNMQSTKKGQKLLKKLGLNGFVRKTDDFYQPIQDMLVKFHQQSR